MAIVIEDVRVYSNLLISGRVGGNAYYAFYSRDRALLVHVEVSNQAVFMCFDDFMKFHILRGIDSAEVMEMFDAFIQNPATQKVFIGPLGGQPRDELRDGCEDEVSEDEVLLVPSSPGSMPDVEAIDDGEAEGAASAVAEEASSGAAAAQGTGAHGVRFHDAAGIS